MFNEETAKAYVAFVQNFDKDKGSSGEGTEPTTETFETRLIFCLADLFKNLDSGRYYGTLPPFAIRE